jgi:polar amino acid transport system permease protein
VNAGLFHQYAQWLPSLLDGLRLSLLLTMISLGCGIPLGLVLALVSASKARVLRAVGVLVVELGRGAPALVVLQLVYFGLPSTGVTLSALASACLALSLTTAAYTSEILRAGLQSVHGGQAEASRALGLSAIDGLRFITLPQGLRVALPALMGFSIQIFQTTSLAFTITVPELSSRAFSIGSSTFQYLQVFVLAGLLYAVVSVPSTWLVIRLEKRMSNYL